MYFLEQFKFDIYANEYEGYSAYSLVFLLHEDVVYDNNFEFEDLSHMEDNYNYGNN